MEWLQKGVQPNTVADLSRGKNRVDKVWPICLYSEMLPSTCHVGGGQWEGSNWNAGKSDQPCSTTGNITIGAV